MQWQRTRGLRNVIIQIFPFSTIVVKSPKRVSWSVVEEILDEKASWMQKQIQKKLEVEAQHPKKQFINGEKFLLLGEQLTLKMVPSTANKVFFSKQDEFLHLHLPIELWKFAHNLQREVLQKKLRDYYKQFASRHLQQRVEVFSESMGLKPTRLSFRDQKSRWGSCSSRGHISLNWKIIAAPPTIIDSVVVHELAHLRHMNHSKNFWQLVENHYPNYSESDNWLSENPHSFLFLSETTEDSCGSFGQPA